MIEKKVLMVASVASMIDQFNMPNIRILQEMGYEVHAACNFKQGNTCDEPRIGRFKDILRRMHVTMHQWDCPRDIRPVQKCLLAYRQLWDLTGRISFAWIHCHSPIGGALARLAAHGRGIRVIYTAHGFHFYQGAPVWNWLFYYPPEKLLSYWTDVLITLNREDARFAGKKLKADKIVHIPGVGIETGCFLPQDAKKSFMQEQVRKEIRRVYRIPEKALLLLSVGELSRRKNHRAVLQALALLHRQDVYYLVCGQGTWEKELNKEAGRLGISEYVRLAGFREDVSAVYRAADIFVFPSLQEGLPVALMEAMAAGLPCVASDIRGNRELVDCRGGRRFAPDDPCRLADALNVMLSDEKLREACGRYNQEKIRPYDICFVSRKMRRIYQDMERKVCGCPQDGASGKEFGW